MADEREIRLTPRKLRALAHPLRTRMLSLLRAEGPATATGLAARLGESTGATSYHLRQLAAHDFIEEDQEHAGTGRERWWRSAYDTTNWNTSELMSDPETRGALDMFMHTVMDEHMRRVATYVAEKHRWPTDWVDAFDIGDLRMPLTPDRAKRLQDELFAVLERYRDEAEEAEKAGTEQVVIGVQIVPYHPTPTAPGEDAG